MAALYGSGSSAALGTTGDTLTTGRAGAVLDEGVFALGCVAACELTGLVDAGHCGSGVLEQAASATVQASSRPRLAWVVGAWPAPFRYGAKTGALGFVIVL